MVGLVGLCRFLNRAAPEIVTTFAANIPATAIRAKIRQEFEKNKYVDDLEAVDILLLKGYQEYQETVNAWKMDSHLFRLFTKEEVSQDGSTTEAEQVHSERTGS